MYEVEITIPNSVLAELTYSQLEDLSLGRMHNWWALLGLEERLPSWTFANYDPRGGYHVRLRTEEVIKPELFGHPLPYTARRLA